MGRTDFLLLSALWFLWSIPLTGSSSFLFVLLVPSETSSFILCLLPLETRMLMESTQSSFIWWLDLVMIAAVSTTVGLIIYPSVLFIGKPPLYSYSMFHKVYSSPYFKMYIWFDPPSYFLVSHTLNLGVPWSLFTHPVFVLYSSARSLGIRMILRFVPVHLFHCPSF